MVLVMNRLGHEVAQSIDWSAPRLLCVAGGFTKYDEHAVQQSILNYIHISVMETSCCCWI